MPDVAWGIGAFVLVMIVAGAILLVVSKRAHFLNWKFGIFFESEERYNGDDKESDAE